MAIPISQMWTVSKYVMSQRLKKNKRYPLVLMLEPLFKCNLKCNGCGKIQYPKEILEKKLTLQECLQAANECNTPIVSIAGGEPLLHPQIDKIVEGLIKQKRYIYLCTNAILLKKKLEIFKPSKYLTFSIHLDGLEPVHDKIVNCDGVYQKAIEGIKLALKKEFRVTTNTTLFNDADPEKTREFFDVISGLGVEGMMISPGYNYSKAKEQDNFLEREQTKNLFRKILYNSKKSWNFNHSPLFLEFLTGLHEEFDCTPWGNPSYNVLGWQSPCYLLEKEYKKSFRDLMETTEWEKYGRKSKNSECVNCMVHCGYEPTAVHHTFWTGGGFASTVKAAIGRPNIPAPNKEN